VNGAERIAAERERQKLVEGYTQRHDLRHDQAQLAWAAVCYAAPQTVYTERTFSLPQTKALVEPWPSGWDRRPSSRVRDLEKAGALIAAEIDRLLAEAEE
jgi:hypothetical protein